LPRWRRNSTFGPGPRRPHDRNVRARFLFLVRQHRRPGGLSSGHQKVAEALVRLLGADGRLDPAHGFLARLATVSVATVQRALDRMRRLGLLFWQRRLVRDEATGWRCEQTSSAYVLTPAACDLQIARPVQLSLKSKEAREVGRVAQEARLGTMATLAAIAARRMRTLGLA
jgi:hypothetical protein